MVVRFLLFYPEANILVCESENDLPPFYVPRGNLV